MNYCWSSHDLAPWKATIAASERPIGLLKRGSLAPSVSHPYLGIWRVLPSWGVGRKSAKPLGVPSKSWIKRCYMQLRPRSIYNRIGLWSCSYVLHSSRNYGTTNATSGWVYIQVEAVAFCYINKLQQLCLYFSNPFITHCISNSIMTTTFKTFHRKS